MTIFIYRFRLKTFPVTESEVAEIKDPPVTIAVYLIYVGWQFCIASHGSV